jgi:hypothetical protein
MCGPCWIRGNNPSVGKRELVAVLSLGVVLLSAGCGGSSSSSEQSSTQGSKQNAAPASVPPVVGKNRFVARKELDHQGLHMTYAFLGDQLTGQPCVGSPSQGKIIRQKPRPGTKLDRHASVEVQSGCPPLADLRPCPAKELHLSGTVQAVGAGSPNGIDGFVKHIYGDACRLKGEIQVSLVHPGGTLATEVGGNPSSIPIDEQLGVGETGDITWGWSGCPHGKFVAVFSGLGGLTAKRNAETYCQEGGIADRLYPSHGEFAKQPFSGLNSDRAYLTARRALAK